MRDKTKITQNYKEGSEFRLTQKISNKEGHKTSTNRNLTKDNHVNRINMELGVTSEGEILIRGFKTDSNILIDNKIDTNLIGGNSLIEASSSTNAFKDMIAVVTMITNKEVITNRTLIMIEIGGCFNLVKEGDLEVKVDLKMTNTNSTADSQGIMIVSNEGHSLVEKWAMMMNSEDNNARDSIHNSKDSNNLKEINQ